MALSTELFNKLVQDDISLVDKLVAAKTLFSRSEFSYINRKEELVLDWLLFECEKNFNYDVWVLLRDCLGSENMKSLKAIDIKTSTKMSLVQLLIKSLNQEAFDGPVKKKRKRESSVNQNYILTENCIIGECVILCLESNVFLFYFRKNIQQYVELSRLTLKSAAENKDFERLVRYVKSLIYFYEQSLIKEDIYKAFIEDLFLHIIEIYNSIQDQNSVVNDGNFCNDSRVDVQKRNNCVKSEILLLIKKLIFPSYVQKSIGTILLSLFEGKKIESPILRLLFQYLIQKTSMTPNKNVSCLYSLTFEAFTMCFPDNFSKTFHFFVIMCLFIGFEPHIQNRDTKGTVCLLESEKVSKVLCCNLTSPNLEFSCSVLQVLISGLQNVSIRVEETLKGISFKQWMQTLICNLVSCKTSPVVYDIIRSVLDLNPLIIEPIVKKILKCILLKRKDTDEEKEAYRLLFDGLISSFIKLHKVQELLRSNILPILKENIAECRQSGKKKVLEIPVTDVIPRRFATTFGDNVGILPGKMCGTLLRMFKSELNNDVVEPMIRGEFDEGQKLYLGIVDMLLTSYLGGVRLAEQSVLQPISQRFIESLKELGKVMGKLGIAIIQHSKSAEELACFLHMSHAVGEITILFRLYSPWAVEEHAFPLARSIEPHCATDMHCLLSFLNPQQWNNISDKVLEYGDNACEKALTSLVLQKLRVLILFGEELENVTEMQSSICEYLIDTSKSHHIYIKSSELGLLSTLLSRKQLLSLAEQLVTDICSQPLSSEVLNSLHNIHLKTNLIAALGWVSLRRIADIFSNTERQKSCEYEEIQRNCLLRKILQSINFSDILKTKKEGKVLKFFVEFNKTLYFTYASVIEDSRNEEDFGEIDYSALFRYTTLLRNLPLIFLPERMQTAFVFSVLTMLLMLLNYCEMEKKQIDELDGNKVNMDESAMSVRINCVEILQGFLEGPAGANVIEHVDSGMLIQLLHRCGACSKDLLQVLFQLSTLKPTVLEGLAKAVCISEENLEQNFRPCASPISVILLKTLRKESSEKLDKESTTKYKALVEDLLIAASKRIDRLMKTGKVPERDVLFLMESYCCVLSSFIQKVSFVLQYVDTFISCAFSVLNNEHSPSEEKKTAELLLELVMQNQKHIEPKSCKRIVQEVNQLFNVPQLLGKILMHSEDEDFRYILSKISLYLVTRNRKKKFPNLDLFTALMLLPLPYSRARSIEGIVVLVSSRAYKMILEGNHKDKILKFVKFLMAVSRRPKVPLPSCLADIILTITVCAVEITPNSLEEVTQTIHDVAHLLICLVSSHFPLLEDRIPAFLLAYRAILHYVMQNSADDRNLGYEASENLAKSVLHLELLSQEAAEHPKHFRLVSQFFVADFLLALQQTAINKKVKFHVMNSIYMFMKLCDGFAISHLSHALPPASLELFKSILSDYKKYHRYTGKV